MTANARPAGQVKPVFFFFFRADHGSRNWYVDLNYHQ